MTILNNLPSIFVPLVGLVWQLQWLPYLFMFKKIKKN